MSEDEEDGALTADTTTRWEYLSSFITLLLYVTFCALLLGGSLGLLSLGAISQAWFVLYGSALTASTGWLFGREYWDAKK